MEERRPRMMVVSNQLPVRVKPAKEDEEVRARGAASAHAFPVPYPIATAGGATGPPVRGTGRVSTVACLAGSQGAVGGFLFEWDEDALYGQAKDGIPSEFEVVYVGSLGVEVALQAQEKVSTHLLSTYNCLPVFLGSDLRDKYYKHFW